MALKVSTNFNNVHTGAADIEKVSNFAYTQWLFSAYTIFVDQSTSKSPVFEYAAFVTHAADAGNPAILLNISKSEHIITAGQSLALRTANNGSDRVTQICCFSMLCHGRIIGFRFGLAEDKEPLNYCCTGSFRVRVNIVTQRKASF